MLEEFILLYSILLKSLKIITVDVLSLRDLLVVRARQRANQHLLS